MDKIICIYNKTRTDSRLSAAMVKKRFIKKYGDVIKSSIGGLIFNLNKTNNPYGRYTANTLSMLGWDYGDKIPDLSGYSRVITIDTAFSML